MMKLRSSFPYWLMNSGFVQAYPSLSSDLHCDIAIIGGGITGALLSYHLTEAGISHVMIDKANVGMGSTCASTALLQYEIDVPLHKLARMMPELQAAACYRLCGEAIGKLEHIANKVAANAAFKNRESLQFASYKSHVEDLKAEYTIRKKHRIAEMEWLEQRDLENKYGFEKPAGLLSHCGATMNPYCFTHALLKHSVKKGAAVYQHTPVSHIEYGKASIRLLTGHYSIRCKKLIVACGYESQQYLPKQVEIPNSTYAIISEPIPGIRNFWHRNSLIWETADPYLYLRTTEDHRIIIGGKDIPAADPVYRDSLLSLKTTQLEQAFARLFPHLPFKTDFAWSGFFCKTRDGLPYIGSVKGLSNTYFALGFGGNGITFSLTAAELIRDTLLGKKNAGASLFSFDR